MSSLFHLHRWLWHGLVSPNGDFPPGAGGLIIAADRIRGPLMEDFLAGSGLTVQMMLCDSAQVAGGKLFILGGGVAAIGPKPQPLALALQITVPWDQANIPHDWRIELFDEDGHPIKVGEQPVVVRGKFEAGRPPGLRPGSPLGVSLAISLTPLPLPGGSSYTFGLTIDEQTQPDWRVRFFVKPKAPRPA